MSKTVYLLGAGASAASDFKLPVMDNFLNDALFLDGKYDCLKNFIKHYFPGKSFSEINIEEVITFIEFEGDRFNQFASHPHRDLVHVKSEFDLFLQERISSFMKKGSYCSKFTTLFRCFQDTSCSDSIITLNYDHVIEMTLVEIRKRVEKDKNEFILDRMYSLLGEVSYIGGTPFGVRQNGYYLKLHGSLGWFYCSNSGCKNHQYFFAERLTDGGFDVNERSVCQICGSKPSTVIVPPMVSKSFQKFPKLGLLWNLAFREIAYATSLVIIGLSFRETDLHLQWLIKKALLDIKWGCHRGITVIDPNKDVFERIKALIGPDCIYQYYPSLEAHYDPTAFPEIDNANFMAKRPFITID